MSEETRTLVWNFNPYHPFSTDEEISLRQRVYLAKWQALVKPPRYIEADGACFTVDAEDVARNGGGYPISQIFPDRELWNERNTRLAANFILFLGTKDGAKFLETGRDATQFTGYPYAFALTVSNIPDLKGGMALRDKLASDFDRARRVTDVGEVRALEAVAFWLGSSQGSRFLSDARNKIGVQERARRLAALAALRTA